MNLKDFNENVKKINELAGVTADYYELSSIDQVSIQSVDSGFGESKASPLSECSPTTATEPYATLIDQVSVQSVDSGFGVNNASPLSGAGLPVVERGLSQTGSGDRCRVTQTLANFLMTLFHNYVKISNDDGTRHHYAKVKTRVLNKYRILFSKTKFAEAFIYSEHPIKNLMDLRDNFDTLPRWKPVDKESKEKPHMLKGKKTFNSFRRTINLNEFKQFLKREKIRLIFTAVDCAFSNGSNERANQTLVNRIRCRIHEQKTRCWPLIADECVSEYNNTIHSSTGFTPEYPLLGSDNFLYLLPQLMVLRNVYRQNDGLMFK